MSLTLLHVFACCASESVHLGEEEISRTEHWTLTAIDEQFLLPSF